MAERVLVDAGFIVALLSRRDAHHAWAAAQVRRFPPPWTTCDAVLSEAVHLLGASGCAPLAALLRRRALVSAFDLGDHLEEVLRLLEKYRDVPASLADACLVRMTETLAGPVVLTTDADFQIYRRHGRQVVPVIMPGRKIGRRR
jgi:predicted nucleic acid-binding protein